MTETFLQEVAQPHRQLLKKQTYRDKETNRKRHFCPSLKLRDQLAPAKSDFIFERPGGPLWRGGCPHVQVAWNTGLRDRKLTLTHIRERDSSSRVSRSLPSLLVDGGNRCCVVRPDRKRPELAKHDSELK